MIFIVQNTENKQYMRLITLIRLQIALYMSIKKLNADQIEYEMLSPTCDHLSQICIVISYLPTWAVVVTSTLKMGSPMS
jgi:hypothetical protein